MPRRIRFGAQNFCYVENLSVIKINKNLICAIPKIEAVKIRNPWKISDEIFFFACIQIGCQHGIKLVLRRKSVRIFQRIYNLKKKNHFVRNP